MVAVPSTAWRKWLEVSVAGAAAVIEAATTAIPTSRPRTSRSPVWRTTIAITAKASAAVEATITALESEAAAPTSKAATWTAIETSAAAATESTAIAAESTAESTAKATWSSGGGVAEGRLYRGGSSVTATTESATEATRTPAIDGAATLDVDGDLTVLNAYMYRLLVGG